MYRERGSLKFIDVFLSQGTFESFDIPSLELKGKMLRNRKF